MAHVPKNEAPSREAFAQWRAAADRLATSSAGLDVGGVDAWSLFLQIGLHMPRFDQEVASRDEVIDAEAKRLWRRLVEIRHQVRYELPDPAYTPVLTRLKLAIVPDPVAQMVHECFHYLMSFRTESLHLGLFRGDEKVPWTLVSLSPFDLENLTPRLGGERTQSTLVLSRVYAFPGTPKNAISFTLARLREWLLVHRSKIDSLVTYCNPNLGFTGASYQADNWHLLGYEDHTRYTYLDRNYITDRRVFQLFGQTAEEVVSDHPNRISFSKWNLQPLRLFFRKLSESHDKDEPHPPHFDRWNPSVF